MDFVLPFACPKCAMRSVAVWICPECRLALVAMAMAPGHPPPASAEGEGREDPPLTVHTGLADECEEVARILQREGVTVFIAKAGETPARRGPVFEVQVPVSWSEQARTVLAAAWEREAERQGLDPVTEGEALALEAQGLCPACGDPLLPGSPACNSCGIALA